MKYSLLVTAILTTIAHAGESNFHVPPEHSIKCGTNTTYTGEHIRNAAIGACRHVRDGTTANGGFYPHEFHNQEGFRLFVEGPYVAFPIISEGIYEGGAPGRDRVIITKNDCTIAGHVYQTNHRRTGFFFMGCSETVYHGDIVKST